MNEMLYRTRRREIAYSVGGGHQHQFQQEFRREYIGFCSIEIFYYFTSLPPSIQSFADKYRCVTYRAALPHTVFLLALPILQLDLSIIITYIEFKSKSSCCGVSSLLPTIHPLYVYFYLYGKRWGYSMVLHNINIFRWQLDSNTFLWFGMACLMVVVYGIRRNRR